MKKKKWTTTEIYLLQSTFPKGGWKASLDQLSSNGFERSESAIITKASDLSLTYTAHWWSEVELQILKESYPIGGIHLATQSLWANGFHRSKKAVLGKAKALKIKSSGDGRFKKGQCAANKGKLMSSSQREKSKLGWYQKGALPHNTLEDGAIRIRKNKNGKGYQFIRIARNQWKLYHRHLWETHYGSIPRDRVVYFKDGNTLHCAIENLGLRTRKEALQQNIEASGGIPGQVLSDNYIRQLLRRAGLPPEAITPNLIELKRAQLLLKREIKKNGKHS